ncbi:uncharacterized protein LOC135297839 [Passer domesticus]|uniref:uncharacterized protein LOC135297839 n=1 Tax=Passer domesticus TaxID=48849 RepID=UPI0030FE8839
MVQTALGTGSALPRCSGAHEPGRRAAARRRCPAQPRKQHPGSPRPFRPGNPLRARRASAAAVQPCGCSRLSLLSRANAGREPRPAPPGARRRGHVPSQRHPPRALGVPAAGISPESLLPSPTAEERAGVLRLWFTRSAVGICSSVKRAVLESGNPNHQKVNSATMTQQEVRAASRLHLQTRLLQADTHKWLCLEENISTSPVVD